MTIRTPQQLYFSSRPGHIERHAQRRAGNSLFSTERRSVSQDEVDAARRDDELEHAKFIDLLGEKLQETVDLPKQVESEIILKLRAELDRLYAIAASLHGDTERYTGAIGKMIGVLNGTVRANIGNDTLAIEELEEQDIARAEHTKLLAYPLIADLLLENSAIAENELAATLLSETDENAAIAALHLLDPSQQQAILNDAEVQIASLNQPKLLKRLDVLRTSSIAQH